MSDTVPTQELSAFLDGLTEPLKTPVPKSAIEAVYTCLRACAAAQRAGNPLRQAELYQAAEWVVDAILVTHMLRVTRAYEWKERLLAHAERAARADHPPADTLQAEQRLAELEVELGISRV